MTANESTLRIVKDALKPLNTEEIYTWASKQIVMPNAYSSGSKFDISNKRYLQEPFKAIKDNTTPIVVVNKANRIGGTLLLDISIPWIIANRPGPIQFSQATDQTVKDHTNNRIYPLLANCKQLKHIVPANDREYTNTGIQMGSCTLYCNGAKESAFQQKGIQYSFNDEVYQWDRGALQQAMTRTAEWDLRGTSKTVIVSRPGQVNDDFDTIYSRGSQEEWCVPCLSCSMYQFPVWRKQRSDGSYYGMLWDENDITRPSGSWNYPEVYRTVRYECEYCGHKHYDTPELKDKWNREGKYISKNANCDRKVRSFRINAIPMYIWTNLVAEFLDAKRLSDIGIKDNLTEFFQSKITQPYNPSIDQYDGHIKTEVYEVSTDWPEGIARFATIDVQKYHFWMVIREWSALAKSRQLFFGKCQNEEEIKKLLTQFKISDNFVFVDVGNTESTEDGQRHLVYEFVDRNRWTGLRGDHWHDDGWKWDSIKDKPTLFYSPPQWIPNTRNGRHFYNFAPNSVRDILKGLRDGTSFEWKSLDNPEFKKQMFAEKKEPVMTKYGPKWCWTNKKGLPNHAFDCEVMQVVAALIHPTIQVIPKPMI